MKYIDADKLRAEIVRRMDKHWEGLPDADSPEDDWTHNELCELGAYKELEHLETFLDTLEEPVSDCHDLKEAAEDHIRKVADAAGHPGWDWETRDIEDAFIAGAKWQKRKQPKVKGYGVMRKMEDPRPDDWYMDERGKEHCWGYKFNEPCPWPAEVYIMEAKEGAEQ